MTEGGASPGRVLAVTSAPGFMVYLELTIVYVAFPEVGRAFPSASLAEVSWILSAYSIVFAAALLPGGRLADRLGRRRVFLASLLAFTATSGLCAAAPTIELLIAARALQACSAAVLVPSSQALLLNAYPPERWPIAIALWGGASAVAAAIGPSLGALLVDGVGWRIIFYVNVPIGLAIYVLARRVLTESREPGGAPRPDLVGAALAAAAIGALVLGLVQGEEWGWSSTGVLGAFAAGALLLPLVVLRSARHPAPVIELSLLRIREVASANVAMLFVSLAFFATLFSTVLYLTSVWQYSILEAGLALTPSPLAAAIVAVPGGRLTEVLGTRIVATIGALLVLLAGVWLVVVVGTEPSYASEWLPGAVLSGAGVGLAVPTLSAAGVTPLPRARFAVGSALNITMRQLGAALGIAVVVAAVGTPTLAEAPASFDDAWTIVIVAAAMSLLGVRALPPGSLAAPASAAEAGASSVS